MSEYFDLDLNEDRYARFDLIPWWNQKLLSDAKVMVVGAGALGNELIKNLALLGVGNIVIVDMDQIEETNLTRSILYRLDDVGKYKADVAARKAMEINPDVRAVVLNANIITGVGLGVFREMDIVLGGLDNREARLAINQACYKVGKPWIDGAIEVLSGFARVFVPPGPCYECTMTEMDWVLLNKRKSCALLTHDQMLEGKVPTTPTSSSVIAGIQVQEMLKLLHNSLDGRDLPTLAGKGYVFNGLTHDSYVVEYQKKEDCMSHSFYEDIREQDWSAAQTTVSQVLSQIKSDLGPEAVIEFDLEIGTTAKCACGNRRDLYHLVGKLKSQDVVCDRCGQTMQFETTHVITGDEGYPDKTLEALGIPPYHIISGRKGTDYIYYQLSGDSENILGGLCL